MYDDDDDDEPTTTALLPRCVCLAKLPRDFMFICDNDLEILHKEDISDAFARMIQRAKGARAQRPT